MSDPAIASPLTFAIERSGDETLVRCSGRLVAGVSDRLYVEIRELIPGSGRIVLDFTELTHMDSTGLGTLVRLYVHAKSAGCILEVINMGKSIRQLLGVTHLLSVLEAVGKHNIRCG
ncbi:MAG: STAS domain-containing protein [Terriglobales bacterium]|jgi:anti-sigma B factor antagonist